MPGNTLLVSELETALLRCQVLANPKPTFMWLKRETRELRVLTNTSRVSIYTNQEATMYSHQSMMVIDNAQASDSGEYLCEVENSVSTSVALSSILVTINGETEITSIINSEIHNILTNIKAMNECRSDNGISSCQNGGLCTDLVNAYVCTCSRSFQGPNCEILIGI